MKINRLDLLTALEKVKPGLADREIIEQSMSFAFLGGKIATYNDEISITHPVTGLNLIGAVRAEELYKLLGKLEQDTIHIKVKENEMLIKSGNTKAGFTFYSEVKLPLEEVEDVNQWKDLPENFTEALSFTSEATSSDMGSPIFSCVHVRKDGIMEATDNIRFTRYHLDTEFEDDFLLPSKSIKDLVKYPIKKIAQGQAWVHFKTDDETVFSCRIYEGEFPDADSVGILNVEGPNIEFPETFPEILDRASIFTKKNECEKGEVSIHIEANQITVMGKFDYGWFEEKADIKHDDPPLEFLVNSSFLKGMLGRMKSCIVGEQTIKFSGSNWEHVIALLSRTSE